MASDQGNWGYAILGLTVAFLVVVLIFLFLRIITRVWIVHQFWYDDAAIILAVVGCLSQLSTCLSTSLTQHTARNHHRRRPRLCRSQLWLWQTPAVPHSTPLAGIQEVYLRGMDPDICYSHVDQGVHMSVLNAATQ